LIFYQDRFFFKTLPADELLWYFRKGANRSLFLCSITEEYQVVKRNPDGILLSFDDINGLLQRITASIRLHFRQKSGNPGMKTGCCYNFLGCDRSL
jgi:hypothetical protein